MDTDDNFHDFQNCFNGNFVSWQFFILGIYQQINNWYVAKSIECTVFLYI